MLAALSVFGLCLLCELSGALYTIAVSHGTEFRAVCMSLLNSMLGLLTIYLVIEDIHLFPAVVLGDVLGTWLALRLTKYGLKPRRKKIAGRVAHWVPGRHVGRQKLRLGD